MNINRSPAISFLCLVFLILVLSLFESILSWVILLSACAIGIRLAILGKWQDRGPSMRTINLLAVFCAIVLAYFAWQIGFMLGMLNLLVMACALKLIALRKEKDYFHLILSMMFLIGCGFIFQQTISYTLVYVLSTLLLLTSLAFYFSPSMSVPTQIKQVGILCLQAAPIGLLIFFVFPKIGPLWQMPSSQSGQTGISESMTPGDFAELSQSAALAFRATFENQIPAPQARYWRAMVLEEFDGRTWSIHAYRERYQRLQKQARQEFKPNLTGLPLNYEVIVEPTQQHWLFTLDVSQPGNARSGADIWQDHSYQLSSIRPILSQSHYQLSAYPDTRLNQTNAQFDQQLNLQLPDNGNPRTQQWVSELRQQYPDDRDFVAAVLDNFVRQGFVYTLKPALMPSDSVDRFLFDHQAGFCAHYAGALAYVMRLAGIPTRVVVGYQGGEVHQDDYVSVHQYDAHAWVETWLDDNGWQRIDPTAAVSPTRIQMGLQAAMQEEGSFLADAPFSLARLSNIAWINQVRLLLADMDYLWSKWVLGFDQQDQYDLIKSLIGSMSKERLMLFGLGVVLVIGALLAAYFLPNMLRKSTHKNLYIYLLAEQQLAKLGFYRSSWQGIHEFSRRVSKHAHPSVAFAFRQVCASTESLIYSPPNAKNPGQKHTLKQLSKQLKLLKKSVNQQLSQ